MKSINRFLNSQGKVWLNVASSTCVMEEFVNLDNHVFLSIVNIYPAIKRILPKKYVGLIKQYHEIKQKAMLVRYDCRKPLFFPDHSVDHILCSHFLEHVYLNEMEKIIEDFHRVLKDNATLHVIVPSIEKQVELYLNNKNKGLTQAADLFIKDTLLSRECRGSLKFRLLEFLGGFGLQHRWMYDYSSLSTKIKDIGFMIMDRNETPSMNYRLNDDSLHIVACKR